MDGTGNPWLYGDVGIAHGKIVAVGNLGEAAAKRFINAKGLVVCPGFIDVHSHSDWSLVVNPPADNQVAQGVTTEVIGNCGESPFPANEKNRDFLAKWGGPVDVGSGPIEYFSKLSEQGTGLNVVPLVGHNTVRAAVLGEEDRPLTPEALEAIKAHIREAMEAGCVGLSSGLDYSPGVYSETEELIELGKVVTEYGGIYASHIRGHSRNVVAAVEEAIEVGRRNGIRVQISHIGIYGRRNWGKAQRILSTVEEAREEGVEVAVDQLCYPTLGVWWGLEAVFPRSVYHWREGGPCRYSQEIGKLVEVLSDPEGREQLKEEVEQRRQMEKKGWWEEFDIFSDWRDIIVEEVPEGSRNEELVGKDMVEIARMRGVDPCDAYFDLILEERTGLSTVHRPTSLDDFYTFLRSPLVMISTDAIATSADMVEQPFMSMPAHPRHYATYPYLLGKHVREDKVLSLPDAIRKTTSLPAAMFRLKGRGLVKDGMWADLVVFDPNRVGQVFTFLRPCQYPNGIEYVMVNGELVVDGGELTRVLPGRILSRDSGNR